MAGRKKRKKAKKGKKLLERWSRDMWAWGMFVRRDILRLDGLSSSERLPASFVVGHVPISRVRDWRRHIRPHGHWCRRSVTNWSSSLAST